MTTSRDCLCIIGARRGSRRLKGKNKLPLNGKPLFVHAMETARRSAIFDSILFSTDDEEILARIRDFDDVLVDERPQNLADSQTSMLEVIAYLLHQYPAIFSPVHSFCLLTPCQPFRTAEQIQNAYRLYQETKADSLISVTRFPFPPELAVDVVDQKVHRTWTGLVRGERFSPRFYPNGAITIVNKDYFMQHTEVFSSNTVAFEVPWPYSLDIDEERDYQLALLLEKIFL
ncbi:MAG: acylneuraminate cytidylyltransferase family protein [Candidatus Omnitrophota bacterium]|jgi:CMP-N-acetylneuraminic acid synthetase|nr:MAG: acylneuraminate cytidylyltransferase family protein [Candidatus Omnitrophota bacterium]